MNEVHAIDLAALLKGLMTRMTDDQVREVKSILVDQDYTPAERALREYARSERDFSLAEFRRCMPRQDRGAPQYQRTCQYRQQMRSEGLRSEEEKGAIDREYADIARGLPAEAIDKLARDAMGAAISSPMRERLLRRGPEGSRVVRWLIVRLMVQQAAGNAAETAAGSANA